MVSFKQGGIKYYFLESFGMTRPEIEPPVSQTNMTASKNIAKKKKIRISLSFTKSAAAVTMTASQRVCSMT